MIDLAGATGSTSIDERPVVALSAALADAISHCADNRAPLTLVTPDGSRGTFPLRLLALSGALTWVARTDTGEFFDALSGRTTAVGGRPAGVEEDARHRQWITTPGGVSGPLVSCTIAVQHPAAGRLQLGAADTLCRATTGRPPHGWGTSEPAAQPWNVDAITAFARRRAPRPTSLVVVGTGFIAMVTVTRTSAGVQEEVVALIAGPDERSPRPTIDATRTALEELATKVTIGFALVQHRQGLRDLTTAARAEDPSTPAVVVIGPRACHQLGVPFLESSPLTPPRRLGHEQRPGLLWSIDEPFDAAWQRLAGFVAYVGAERLGDLAPNLRPGAGGG